MRVRAYICALAVATCLLRAGGNAQAADPVPPQQTARVAILPFANLAETEEAAPYVAAEVRQALASKSVELADSNLVAEVLRKYRVRNAAEIGLIDAQAVAGETAVRYLLLGSIDRYAQEDSTAEVALSARLFDVATASIVWANSVSYYSDARIHLFGLGGHRVQGLARHAVKSLVHRFRYNLPSRSKRVQAVRVKGRTDEMRPCRKILLVTFGNETSTHFAGNIVGNQVLTAMVARGFTPVDPGRVRELMLDSKELMQGEISTELLKKCRDELGADFVLTGTVSRYEAVRGQLLDEPAVAFEARLIDTGRGELVWGRTYAGDGKDSAWIFNLGYTHGLTELSERMSRKLVTDLPVRRSRVTGTPLAEQIP